VALVVEVSRGVRDEHATGRQILGGAFVMDEV
jgi:hypothetical protein